jgi:hypothetical protein
VGSATQQYHAQIQQTKELLKVAFVVHSFIAAQLIYLHFPLRSLKCKRPNFSKKTKNCDKNSSKNEKVLYVCKKCSNVSYCIFVRMKEALDLIFARLSIKTENSKMLVVLPIQCDIMFYDCILANNNAVHSFRPAVHCI